jgi:hypothetical protein
MKVITRAWEQRDADAAANLFTENATYQENPFGELLRDAPRSSSIGQIYPSTKLTSL